MFNPVDEATYRRVVGDWLAAFLVTLRHVAAHPQPQQGGGGGAGRGAAARAG